MLSSNQRLAAEYILVFWVLPPMVAATKPHGWMYLMLWLAAILAWRWLDRNHYRFDDDWNTAALSKKLFFMMVARFVPLCLALGIFTFVMIPDRLFSLPLQKPQLWAMVMIFYPVLSVIPQEIIFRSFLFRRYATLFASPKAMILASALAFGWVHILLLNWVAVVFSALGGVLFADTYSKTRSLSATCAEHALYGCTVFTLGLGYYFYHGQAVH